MYTQNTVSRAHEGVASGYLDSTHIAHHDRSSLIAGLHVVYLFEKPYFAQVGNVDNVPVSPSRLCSRAILVDEGAKYCPN